MRNFLLLLTFLMTQLSFAQVNVLVSDSGTFWRQSSSCNWGDGCITELTETFQVNGTYNNGTHTYHKIERQFYSDSWSIGGSSCSGVQSGTDTFAFGIRENAGMVYKYDPVSDTEIVWYNFNAQIGDTIQDPFFGVDIVVTEIDTFISGVNTIRLRWYGEDGNGQPTTGAIIEGIGGNAGLTQPIIQSLECGYNLECYGEMDTAILEPNNGNCMLEIGHLSVAEANPFDDILLRTTQEGIRIEFPADLRNGTYRLFSVSGSVLKEERYTEQLAIDNADFAEGIYFLQLQKGEHQTVLKVNF